MASKSGLQTLRNIFAQLCGSGDTVEAEQLIDIVLQSVGEENDKEAGIAEFQKTLGGDKSAFESKVKSTVKELLSGYQGDKLPVYAVSNVTKMSVENMGDTIRGQLQDAGKATSVVEACDEYIAAILYHQQEKPKPAEIATGEDAKRVLASIYAGVQCGANYLTVCYPPPKFINDVARCVGMSRDIFHATVIHAMNNSVPFYVMCENASNELGEFDQMCADYEELFAKKTATVKRKGKEEAEEVAVEDLNVAEKAQYGLGSLAKSGVDMVGSVFGNHEKHTKVLNETAGKFTGLTRNLGKKLGEKAIWIWRIIAAVDVISLLVRLVLIVVSFFVDITGPKTDAAAGFLSKIPIIGGLVAKTATGMSATAIRGSLITRSIPVIIALAVIAVMAVTVWRRKETGKRDNVKEMLVTILVLASTVASVFFLGQALIALISSRGEEYFWAAVYSKL